jgi:hypothetical protein
MYDSSIISIVDIGGNPIVIDPAQTYVMATAGSEITLNGYAYYENMAGDYNYGVIKNSNIKENAASVNQVDIEGKSFDEIDPNCWDFYSDWHKDVFGYRPHGIVCGEYINPHTVKCKHCGTELVEGINHSAESYEVDLCDACMEYYYGYCDKCGKLFEYYPEMLEHAGTYGNVLCKKCLAEE